MMSINYQKEDNGCNECTSHLSPSHGAGWGITRQRCSVLTFALSPQCGGNDGDLIYLDKHGSVM